MGNTCTVTDDINCGCNNTPPERENSSPQTEDEDIFVESKFKVSQMKGLSLIALKSPEVTKRKRLPKIEIGTHHSCNTTECDFMGLNTCSLATTASRS